MKLNAILAALVGLAQPSWTFVPPGFAWEAPYVMSATSGTITISNRNFENLDTGVLGAAYTSAAGAKYIFQSCRFRSKTTGVFSNHSVGVELRNCVYTGLNPDVDGLYNGGFVQGQYNWLIVDHSTMTGGGIRVSGTNPTTLEITYNRCYNINGMKSNGTGLAGRAGYRTEANGDGDVNVAFRQFFQANGVTIGSGSNTPVIAWNYVEGQPLLSRAGDYISFIGSGGKWAGGVSGDGVGSYVDVHHNCLYGNYSWNPYDKSNTSRGVMMESLAADVNKGFIIIRDNWLSAINGFISINFNYHGSFIKILRNKGTYSHKLAGAWLSAPAFPYSADAASTGTYQEWTDNSYHAHSQNYHATGADDGAGPFVRNSGNTGNSQGSGWIKLATDAAHVATEADEAAVPASFWAAVAVAGYTIGSSLS